MQSLLVERLSKNYGTFPAIKEVSFEARPGEFVVLVGPSGCGKSTLLRTIAGLEKPTSGSIAIGGRDITHVEPSERGVAMVFQNYALYPHMTVRQNMGFALRIARRPRDEIEAAVTRAAQILRIADQLDKKPKDLSGGQRQRVAIGRAITRSPAVFLFDEPLSNLDAALRSQMRVELGRLHSELKATMVYVTHDQTEAMTMASRIVVLNQGRVEQVGEPLELYNRPVNRFVAGFLGSPRMNFIRGRASTAKGNSIEVAAEGLLGAVTFEIDPEAASPANGDRVVIGIRPEGFGVGKDGPWKFGASMAVVESLGRETLIYADGGSVRSWDSESHEGYFAVHLPSQLAAHQGDQIELSIEPRAVYLFDEQGRSLRHPPRGVVHTNS